MKHKYALYPIIMSGCALFCFLLVVIIFASDVVQPLWWQTMLLLVPCLILGIIGFFAVKGKLKVSVTVILTTALSIVLFLVSVFYLSLLLVWTSTTVTTDIRYYGRAYEKICEELK